ncbi:hypothetical protein ACFPOI_53985 [Nonomuraea angiospora]|uniref:Uncharacterized protein n=1 Tax=Nonomuraea angiospora TaxID=46172 RepID=A0ABR9M6K7_9ACTN|nr:hypothetical protein [Nonomuraea angiospora]MBE1588519.1 hypothetical protein [Nonomuraea angiospora]
MTRKTLPTALLALAVLCGCGGAAETATETAAAPSPSAAAAAKDKKHQLEAAKADCMKQKGFKYVAWVKPEQPQSDEDRRRDAGDYQAMRKHREKYGFEIFAEFIYPKELNAPAAQMASPNQDPNMKLQEALSEAQLGAYHKAKDACMVTAGKQVLGVTLKSNIDYYNQIALTRRRLTASTLDSDPKLMELATAMATCLKGKGYTVTDTAPTALSKRGQDAFIKEQDKIGREQDDTVPDVAPPAKKNGNQPIHMPSLTAEQAKPYLAKEIKAALDDLECGKDFYPVFTPRKSAIDAQVKAQFAF